MSETLIAWLPLYGSYLVALVVGLSAMAVTLPASVLVATAGGFAAAGDLQLWQVIAGAFVGFCIGDQLAYRLGRAKGPWVLERLKSNPARAGLIEKAEGALTRNGVVAILMSRTLLSPIGPYVTYVGGAAGLGWLRFTAPAVVGAALWSGAYGALGYTFADNISQVSSMMGSILGFLAAGTVLVLSGYLLFRKQGAKSGS